MAGYLVLVWHGVASDVHEVSAHTPAQLTLVSDPGALRPAYRVDQPERVQLLAFDIATHWAIFVNGELLLEGELNEGRGAAAGETIQMVFGPSFQ